MTNLIIQEAGKDAFTFINKYTDLSNGKALTISTTTIFNIDNQPENKFEYIINLKRINDIRYINKFCESVNAKLPNGGIFIDCAETYTLRKKRILRKYPPVLNYIYYCFDWVFKRLFPKLLFTAYSCDFGHLIPLKTDS